MTTLNELKQLIINTLNSITDLDVIPFPTSPKSNTEFITYQITNIKDLSYSENIEDNGNVITTFLKEVTFSINIYSKDALEKAEMVRKKLSLTSEQINYLIANVGITRISNTKDLTFLESNFYSKRCQFDVILNYTSTETEDLGFFNKVELSSTQEPLKTYVIAKLEA